MTTATRSVNVWLAVFRFYMGVFWIQHAFFKLQSAEWAAPNGMMTQMVQDMTKESSGPYHDFIVNIVLPNAGVFAHLVAWGETLVGVSLLLGLFTRVGGFGGAFLALNYLLAKDRLGTLGAWTGLDAIAVASSLACALLPTWNSFALDALLFRRRR